jgi:hypothetical protein
MIPDDVFRERLEQTLIELETWADKTRDCAEIDIAATGRYWRMTVTPLFPGSCRFELLINSNQTFDLSLDGEVYENKRIDRFDLFLNLVTAIAAGRVEKIETRSTLTNILIAVEMRVELRKGLDWIGSRTVLKSPLLHVLQGAEERRTFRFLAYRR